MPAASRPRVLLINNDARHFVTHRLAQARLLESSGYAIELAVPPPPDDLPFRSADDRDWFGRLRIRVFPLDRKSVNPLREARSLSALRAAVREAGPDIVHAVTPKGVIYGGLAAQALPSVRGIVSTITGLGYVFSSDAPKARALRPLAGLAYRRAFRDPRARVIFQNPDDRAMFVEAGAVEENKTRLVAGSGVDVSHFAFAEELPAGHGVRIAFFGRMLKDKGVFELAEAARLVRQKAPQAEIHLYGDVDPCNPASLERAQLEAWQSEGLVRWHGAVADVRPALAESHIVCLPSHREGVPMALLEAGAMGRALVATDAPGCREVVRAGETGLLTPIGDVRALADALLDLIQDPERRRRMGRAARALAEREFSKETIAEQVAAVYEECLREGPLVADRIRRGRPAARKEAT